MGINYKKIPASINNFAAFTILFEERKLIILCINYLGNFHSYESRSQLWKEGAIKQLMKSSNNQISLLLSLERMSAAFA